MADGRLRVGELAQKIEALVLDGEVPPGFKLDEQALAQRFGVSRTPVREALRHLASVGLIELRPNRGAFVRTVTPEQLEEMFVAMAELEATCARLAAMSMTPVERRGLQRLHERMCEMAERGQVEDFVAGNETFHTLFQVTLAGTELWVLVPAQRRTLRESAMSPTRSLPAALPLLPLMPFGREPENRPG